MKGLTTPRPEPTLPSPSVGLPIGGGSWRVYLAIVLAFVFMVALAPPLAWAVVWLSHVLEPFSVWYASLFP